MSETTCPDSESDPNRAAVIAHAERRRAMLQELGQVSLVLSKKLARDMMDGPWHPESRHSPARAFDIVTRSLRLTLVLEAKMEAQVVALCNGKMPVAPVWLAEGKDADEEAGGPAVGAGDQPEDPRPADSGSEDPEREDRHREPLREGAEREFDRPDTEGSAYVRFRKRLIAGEDYQDLIEGDFKDCVDEIRAGFDRAAEGEAPNTEPPPCAPSVAARERAPPA
jgi:hypothetical protein